MSNLDGVCGGMGRNPRTIEFCPWVHTFILCAPPCRWAGVALLPTSPFSPTLTPHLPPQSHQALSVMHPVSPAPRLHLFYFAESLPELQLLCCPREGLSELPGAVSTRGGGQVQVAPCSGSLTPGLENRAEGLCGWALFYLHHPACSSDGHRVPLPLPVAPVHVRGSVPAATRGCPWGPTGASVPGGQCHAGADGSVCR